MTPYSPKLDSRSHSSLIILLIASAADIVDFIEYASVFQIVSGFKGVDYLMGYLKFKTN